MAARTGRGGRLQPPQPIPIPPDATPEEARRIRGLNRQNLRAYEQARSAGQGRGYGSSLVSLPRGSSVTGTISGSKDTRFADVGLGALISMVSALWTASRPTATSQYGWGLFWLALGGVMAVEARGAFLESTGYGLVGANAAYLALRTFEPSLRPAAAQVRSGYVRVGYAVVAVPAA